MPEQGAVVVMAASLEVWIFVKAADRSHMKQGLC